MANAGSNAPVASKHIFLHQLSDQQANAKVRFLCCIVDYDDEKGCLTVEHKYPRNVSGAYVTTATIDVNLVLETAKSNLKEGVWLNVIGYVQDAGNKGRRQSNLGRRSSVMNTLLPHVQAVLVWDAGALHVDQYERILKKHLASMNDD
ncbi:hypothetical protein H2198_006627 [Neophaeococcomyces mojaviensis]|uniref:Uncharacterized protein n=1 Tax=Neophaeococcomyces mojaviensis TaxID=3383035 RepID=A0ACC3A2S6_9EURO|nr:hypothetical protein H2198_006627 [Knufia sp. JES_112]